MEPPRQLLHDLFVKLHGDMLIDVGIHRRVPSGTKDTFPVAKPRKVEFNQREQRRACPATRRLVQVVVQDLSFPRYVGVEEYYIGCGIHIRFILIFHFCYTTWSGCPVIATGLQPGCGNLVSVPAVVSEMPAESQVLIHGPIAEQTEAIRCRGFHW